MENNYDTVSEAVNDLIKRGYTTDFTILSEKDGLHCAKTTKTLSPDEFEIDETHRFEGMTDPGDEMIVYAISSKNHDIKGVIVNAYGMYTDADSSKVVAKLLQHL